MNTRWPSVSVEDGTNLACQWRVGHAIMESATVTPSHPFPSRGPMPNPSATPEPATEDLPGADWADVPEGVMRTHEQVLRRLLSEPWEVQLRYISHLREAAATADRCLMSGHEWHLSMLYDANRDLLARLTRLNGRASTLSTGVRNPVESGESETTRRHEVEAARAEGYADGWAGGYTTGFNEGTGHGHDVGLRTASNLLLDIMAGTRGIQPRA